MPTNDILAQMPFIDGFSDGPTLNGMLRAMMIENRQTPGTSSSRPDRTSNARGPSDARRTSDDRGTNDASGPSDVRGTNDTGFGDPFSFSTSYSKINEKMFTREDIEDHSHYISMGGTPVKELHLGNFFRDKEHLKIVLGLYAMKKWFDYFVSKSGTTVWYVTCKDTDCERRLREKKNILSNIFEDKFATDDSDHLTYDIRKDMYTDFEIQMSYEKAWKCLEKALRLVRGTLEDSYSKLSGYLHILKLRNPGTITNFVVEDGRFKYCFFLLGPYRCGFRFFRPIVCVDGSFLKTRYGGQILCAVALDAVNHIFQIAFALVDSKNHNTWTYFMIKLKDAIDDVENLAFMSDRHQSIVHALELVFPNAHHEFHREFEKIQAMTVAVALYLEEIGFEKWVWSNFLRIGYNVMTSNWAVSFNNTTKDARGFSIIAYVAFLRSKV
ncbi:uncharacterized protein LOC133036091 [Cannabis sativa]|uniref:uncharacterized protein LOC133036091 n=1 Tax=Cannabis sativa TaxID=3483 RepID=UPI0029CA1CD1|nr:uncharacterized protein LOC133036091 [Cannabis sativa]